MEEIIITMSVGTLALMGILSKQKIVEKREERKEIKAEKAKADAWQARLEEARLAREAHPERFQAGQVPGVGKDGIYLV